MLNQALHAAQAGRAGEYLDVLGDRHGRFLASLGLKTQHAAKSRHLFFGQGVKGVVLQAGVVHFGDFGVVGQKLSHFHGVGAMRLNAVGQCGQAAHDQPAVKGRGHAAAKQLRRSHLGKGVIV